MTKKLFVLLTAVITLYAGKCYSILTQTGLFTPVYPYNFRDNPNFREVKCNLLDDRIVWDNNLSYVGCYKTYKDANYTLHHLKFNFVTPKIVEHNVTFKDQYVIFPTTSTVKPKNVNKIISKFKPQILEKNFPTKFYGNGIDFIDITKITFMPTVNLYDFYRFYRKHNLSTKVMVLYNGVYSIDYLYQKIHNPSILKKIDDKTYILKVPLYISPTAKLVVNNKTLLLETTPKPVFIMYHGDIYAKNSKFITWNLKDNNYDKREHIPEEELLLIGLQKPRPYFIGLTGSKTYFINNYFKGLGFHSTSATFGIALLHFPKDLIVNKYNLFTFLNQRGLPKGYYIGNTMVDNMMGFYCSEAKNTAIIGNLMYDNLIYNIDPHDYSEGLIIARNITAKAKHAHGIVISRQVNHTIIAQNFSFNNHSAGIMLDRLSNYNYIFDNLSAINGYMGVSIQESDDVLVYKNYLIGNKIDGIIIRNSLRISVLDNYIAYNAKNGVEVLTKNIDGMIYRNFARDPYHKATAAVVEDNKIIDNIFYSIVVKNNAAVYLKDNELRNKYYPNFGGDLNIFTSKIDKNHGKFKLYGIGNPFRARSIDEIRMSKKVVDEARKIFIDASCNNDFVSEMLGKLYVSKYKNQYMAQKEYIRGISQLYPNDMSSYGYFLLSKANTKKEYINAISYIAQSIIFGNSRAKIDISQIPYVVPVDKNDINKAFEIALNRLKNYKVVDDIYSSACKIDDRKKAKIESAWKIFNYKFKHSGAKDYFEYCSLPLKDFTIFTPKIIKKIHYIFAKANEPKKAYYRKLLKENQLIKDSPDCKLVSIRLKRIRDSLDQYYQTERSKMIKVLNPYIDQYLKLINEYRLHKVSKKQIHELMQEN